MSSTEVFLSSTSRDLVRYREAAGRAIRRLTAFHCVQMEDWGAMSVTPIEASKNKLHQCDLVVLIAGHCYGSCPPHSQKSFTQCEYEAAIDDKKDVLVFLAADDSTLPNCSDESDEMRARQKEFRQGLMSSHVIDQFKDEGNLVIGIVTALANWKDAKHGIAIHQTEQSHGLLVETHGLVDIPQLHFSLNPKQVSLELSGSDQLVSPVMRDLAGVAVSPLGGLFPIRGQKFHIQDMLKPIVTRSLNDKDWDVVDERIKDRIEQLLDVDILEILFSAWKASPVLEKLQDESSDSITYAELAEHSVNFRYRPVLQLAVRGNPIANLDFEVRLQLEVSGFNLMLERGAIVSAQGGKVGARGSLKLGELVIAEFKTPQIPNLPSILTTINNHSSTQ